MRPRPGVLHGVRWMSTESWFESRNNVPVARVARLMDRKVLGQRNRRIYIEKFKQRRAAVTSSPPARPAVEKYHHLASQTILREPIATHTSHKTFAEYEMSGLFSVVAHSFVESALVTLSARQNDPSVAFVPPLLELFREIFSYHKSTRALNYANSDVWAATKNTSLVHFGAETGDAELVAKFERAFAGHPTSVGLALELAAAIYTSHKFVPTYAAVAALLEGLAAYSDLLRIVVHLLAPYPAIRTALATESKYQVHFLRAVEQHPPMLGTLLRYAVRADDAHLFGELLRFFALADLQVYEKTLDASKLHGIIAKSRYTSAFRKLVHTDKRPRLVFELDDPILVPQATVVDAIEGCIHFGLFEYIDSLFNKMAIFLVAGPPRQVPLSFGTIREKVDELNTRLLLAQQLSPQDHSLAVMDKRTLKAMLRATQRSRDDGRLMWLSPHLDHYVYTHLQDENTQRHLDQMASRDEKFWEDDASCPLDYELLQLIHDTLARLGMPGLFNTYSNILDFSVLRSM